MEEKTMACQSEETSLRGEKSIRIKPAVIENGLKVKEDHYSYAWLQMPSEDMTLSSMSLTEEDENFPHARMYMIDPLKETEMIVEEALAMADNTHLKLLVIVNNDNSYEIEGLPKQKWRTPVIVVTASTGKKLRKHICRKGVEESVLELVLHMQDEPDYPVLESEIGGVHLCLKVYTTPDGTSNEYKCVWAPFCDPNELGDPMNLVKSPVTYPNMVMHELKEGASMGFFLSDVESMPSTKALLLVNTDNTLAVDKKFYPAGDVSLPTLVVTKEVGTALSRLIDDNPRNMAVNICPLESNVTEEAGEVAHPKHVCLEVCITPTNSTSQKYECAWAPFSGLNELRDPMNLVKSPITYSSMVMHELKEGASMGFFLSTVENMQALLLVNTDNTLVVDKKFYPAGDVSLPTLVVTKEVGTVLSRLINNNPRSVKVALKRTGVVDEEEMLSYPTSVDETEMMTVPEGLIVTTSTGKAEAYPAYWVKHTMPSHPIEWTRMASVRRQFKHVRCIDTETENLNFFVSNFRQETIVAVIFISMDDDCRIEKYDFDNADIDFPALMVPRSVGDYFLQILKEEGVFVSIKVSPNDEITIENPVESSQVVNGLQLQYEKQKTIVYSYSSLNENLKEDLEWHDICMVCKKDAHILCVHLNCPMVPMRLSTKAVLLIGKTDVNPSEESALDLAVITYGDVPIVVVNDSGQQLWHALCQEECISGKIFAQSQKKTGKSDQGKRWNLLGSHSTKHPAVLSLYAKIHQLLYCPDRLQIPSVETFKLVMEHFYWFEKEGGGSDDVQKLHTLICNEWNSTFSIDFPFYLTLVQRVEHLCPKIYKWKSFHSQCRLKLQKLDSGVIHKTTSNFLSGPNFGVNVKEECIDVWSMICHCLRSMLEDAKKDKHSLGYVAPAMKLATLYVKFYSKTTHADGNTSVAAPTWEDLLLMKPLKYELNESNIKGLADCLELGENLLIEKEQCSFSTVLDFIIPTNHVRPFHNVLQSLQNRYLKEWICINDGFHLSSFLQRMLYSYCKWIYDRQKGCKKALTKAGKRLDAIHEGLKLLDKCDSMVSEMSWERNSYKEMWENWFVMLMKFIKFGRNKCPQKDILEFFKPHHSVVKTFEQFLTERIVAILKENVEKLTTDQFCILHCGRRDVIPQEVEEQYIRRLQFDSRIRILEQSWEKLFLLITHRYPYARGQHLLVDFFERAGKMYYENNRSHEFVLHILHLNVSQLFAIECCGQQCNEEDKEVVTKFCNILVKYGTMDTEYFLRKQLDDVLESIPKKHHQFHESVLMKIVEAIMPGVKVNEFIPPKDRSHAVIIEKLSDRLCGKSFNWPCIGLREGFCFELLSRYIEKIGTLSLDALDKYYQIIQLLCKPCQWYVQQNQGIPSEKIINMYAEETSTVLSMSLVVSFRAKYFKHMKTIHEELLSWEIRLQRQDVTYSEIDIYSKKVSTIQKVANTMCIPNVIVVEVHKVKHLYDDHLKMLKKLLFYSDKNRLWCSLFSVLQHCGVDLPSTLESLIDDNFAITILNSQPEMHKKRDIKLSELCKIVYKIRQFLKPLEPVLQFLIFFHLNRSSLFEQFLKKEMQIIGVNSEVNPEEHISRLVIALKKAKTFLEKVMEGTIVYGDIYEYTETDLAQIQVEEEFHLFYKCRELKHRSEQGLEQMISMLKLLKSVNYINKLLKVCEQYELCGCLNDPELHKLTEILKSLESEEKRRKLTPADCHKTWKVVCDILSLNSETSVDVLTVFETVSDSVEFFQFLVEMKFRGKDGEILFRQQYELVTAKLDQDAFTDSVLNHLYGSFFFIVPFMDQTQTLQDLMKKLDLNKQKYSRVQQQLETVKSHMHHIRLWFLRVQEGLLKNVSNDLDSIWMSGKYVLSVPTEAGKECQLRLSFDHFHQQGQTSEWTQEQIIDFVQKLGFLQESAELEKVENFRIITKAANDLFGLVLKLRDLGYSKYGIHTIPCNDVSTAKRMVDEESSKCDSWMRKLDFLLSEFKWLSFFTISKLLLIHSALIDERTSKKELMLEFYHIFKRNNKTWKVVEHATEMALEASQMSSPVTDAKPSTETSSSIEIVGVFMKNIFESNCSLETEQLAQRYELPIQLQHDILIAKQYDQQKLIHLIISIYNGIPEHFDILRCCSATTEHDLNSFMRRILLIPRLYVILEVNRLSFELQEILFGCVSRNKRKTLPSHVYFIETAPSILQQIPWLKSVDCEEGGVTKERDEVRKIVRNSQPSLNSKIHLVFGEAGNGKTYHIRKCLEKFPEDHRLIVSVNESFKVSTILQRMRSLNRDGEPCGLFFNFTFFLGESDDPVKKKLTRDIGWFFFDLLLLGYVEDPSTGMSFCSIEERELEIYIEVPSHSTKTNSNEDLKIFQKELPIFEVIGAHVLIDFLIPYSDDKVQLVCKYLKAYDEKRINKLYRGVKEVRFGTDKDVKDEECSFLFNKYVPLHLMQRKVTLRMFVHYMWRRCNFLEHFPGFIYNSGCGEYIEYQGRKILTDTRHLGSTLMETMLDEVDMFCNPNMKGCWGERPHQQLIYDFSGGGGTIGVVSHLSDPEKQRKFTELGVELPSPRELLNREVLDSYLARALGIKMIANRLKDIDECKYVLTVDYALKMLDIHERYQCGIPVIIEGETGVGKTALVDMLSVLWNRPWLDAWEYSKECITEKIHELVTDALTCMESSERTQVLDALHSIASGNVSLEALKTVGNVSMKGGGKVYLKLQPEIQSLKHDPLLIMLDCNPKSVPCLPNAMESDSLEKLFENSHIDCENTAALLLTIFSAKVKSVLHKLNVHGALRLEDVQEFFRPVIQQASSFEVMFKQYKSSQCRGLHVPCVIVYLDEINTSSCLGIFKELITDKTLNGEEMPTNIFIIASCNPHRGHSLTTLNKRCFHDAKDDTSWLTGAYYVQELHPTLDVLKWDYGSLNSIQEDEYITAKLRMIECKLSDDKLSDEQVSSLTELISLSQEKMREYAEENISKSLEYADKSGLSSSDIKMVASKCAESTVSQRDIQRVFNFYQWLKKTFEIKSRKHELCGKNLHERAMLLSLGLVYYMRLSSVYREKYQTFLQDQGYCFSEVYDKELQWLIEQVDLPHGIAKTKALKENLYAVVACTATRTPLIIVGDPGSSKTLSFNVAMSNVQGKESKKEIFRITDVYHSLLPYFYQCSRRTTSFEIERVFKRAIDRQRSLAEVPLPVYCVVFMDEAGLPEQKMESLKVLHYYLDAQEVSFVAISNHILDAAKTNRAVSLFRPRALNDDLQELATQCIMTEQSTVSLMEKEPKKQVCTPKEKQQIKQLCSAFEQLMRHDEFRKLYGLRDFIHFVRYLKSHRVKSLDAQLLLKGIERNFNGSRNFANVCQIFFSELNISEEKVHRRNTLKIIRSSIEERGKSVRDNRYSWVRIESRYKLIIDPSEDQSLVRLLFSYNILPEGKTRVYICSDFPSDQQSEIITIQRIIHSIAAGHMILMCQTDKIHESFYDLFNQTFRSIKGDDGPQDFANIAIGAHSKPCRVDPNFLCFIVIDETELQHCPSPFLNRFEKYYLDHKSILELKLNELPPCLGILMRRVYIQVKSFIKTFESTQSGIFGLCEDTLESLFLTVLPVDYEYNPLSECGATSCCTEPSTVLLLTIQEALIEHAHFRIPKCDDSEIHNAAQHIFDMIMYSKDSEFQRILKDLQSQNIISIVDEAFNCLYKGPHPRNTEMEFEIYTDTCTVISVIMQWLVMYLCKRLMQLVTPEALVIHNQEIPRYYSQFYMKFQEHFDFKGMIKQQLMKNERNGGISTTKLICFTRESGLIHKCPPEYFPEILDRNTEDITESGANRQKRGSRMNEGSDVLRHIWDDQSKFMFLKLSTAHSQGILQERIKCFLDSNCDVFIIVINTQLIHKRMINHLRIMIEDEERCKGNCKKMFVLLFQIPPQQFYTRVYPALFLQGWDHHYLDSIASVKLTPDGLKEQVLNIELWFKLTCLEPSRHTLMTDSLKQLLEEAVPVVVSKLVIPTSTHFSPEVDASSKTQSVKRLFSGDKEKVGNILLKRFCLLWNPTLMAEYIDSAANTGYSSKSTLNIIETVETTFRFLFFDFLIYMLSCIAAGLNLDWIFDSKDYSESVFYFVIEFLPCPALYLLPTHCARLRTHLTYSEKKTSFPFFNEMSEAMDEVVERCKGFRLEDDIQECDNLASIQLQLKVESRIDLLAMKRLAMQITKLMDVIIRRRLNQDLKNESQGIVDTNPDDSGDQPRDSGSSQRDEKHNSDGDEKRINSLLEIKYIDSLAAVLLALRSKEKDKRCLLCEDYQKDFFSTRYGSEDFPGRQNLLPPFISDLDDVDVVTRLVFLHIQSDIDPVGTSNLQILLKKLSEIHVMEKTIGSSTFIPSLQSTVLSPNEDKPTLGSHMVVIIESLFEALHRATSKNKEAMLVWQRSYQNIVPYLSLEHLCTPSMQEIEAKFSVMQATYLIIQASNDAVTGLRLYQQFYRKSQQLPKLAVLCLQTMEIPRKRKPRLKEMIYCGLSILLAQRECQRSVDAVEANTFTNTHQFDFQCHDWDDIMKHYFEELLAFFFSKTRVSYNDEDCYTLLECMNSVNFPSGFNQVIITPQNISVLRYFLSRLLTHDKRGKNYDTLLNQFIVERRQLVGSVIVQEKHLGVPGPYIPLFYQMQPVLSNFPTEAMKNRLMQQPLCHFYFITVLEHLKDKQYQLLRLNSLITKVNETLNKEISVSEKALLHIEKQALIQVMIHQIALQFDYRKPLLMHKLQIKRLTADTNMHICDDSTGGSEQQKSGHGLVSALHVQTYLSDSKRMLCEIRDGSSPFLDAMKCIIPLGSATQWNVDVNDEKIPFLGLDAEDPIGQYYRDIKNAVMEIHKSNGSKESTETLVALARQSVNDTQEYDLSKCRKGMVIKKEELFRMLIWLITYYGFKKEHSSCLSEFYGKTLSGILLPEFASLLQCFAYPPCMTIEPECVISGDDEQDVIFDLFNHTGSAKDKSDSANEYIRDALAHLIAAIVACPPNSNHLWYNLFMPEELKNTLLPGFMLEGAVGPENCYDTGVCLTSDGIPSKPVYYSRLKSETLSVNSLHLLLWASFGALCISLVHTPGASESIKGNILSDHLHIRRYCLGTVIKLWNCIGSSLRLSAEEQNFYIKRCMLEMIHVSSGSERLLQKGIFVFKESTTDYDTIDSRAMELDNYERVWHQKIFSPCFNTFQEEYQMSCKCWNASLLDELRHLKRVYPHYPSYAELIHDLLCEVSTGICNAENDLFPLTQFALEYERLCVIGLLLPDLIEFYQWIHTELVRHRVTWTYADTHTVEDVLVRIDEKYPERQIIPLYDRVTENFNKYLNVIEGNIHTSEGRRDGRVKKLTSGTKLLSLLSTSTTEEEEQHDYIFLVIADMVEFHNQFLQKVCNAAKQLPATYLKCPVSDEIGQVVKPKQISSNDCIIPSHANARLDHIQLFRKRWLQPNVVIKADPHSMKYGFDFYQLQFDIINEFIVNKPLIDDPRQNLRVKFFFQKKGSPESCIPSLIFSVFEAEETQYRNWGKLDARHIQEIECEFHSAEYQKLMEIITGLWTVSGHIKKYMDQNRVAEIADLPLPKFLLKEYLQEESAQMHGSESVTCESVLKSVGFIKECSLSSSQLKLLMELKVKHVYSMWKLLTEWMKDRVYNFHYLPINMKVRLGKKAVDNLENLPHSYDGPPQTLLQHLILLEEALLQNEECIRNDIAQNVQKSIKGYMRRDLHLDMKDQLELIPEGVQCQNYVHFRVVLNRVKSQVQEKIEKCKHVWIELVDDLWESENLKHLRDAATPYEELEPGFIYDPCTQQYGFEAWATLDISPLKLDDESEQIHKDSMAPEPNPLHDDDVVQEAYSKKSISAKAKGLTVEDVGAFLQSIGLPQYVENFVSDGIDGETLLGLDDNDLKELKVEKGFQRKKILIKYQTFLENK